MPFDQIYGREYRGARQKQGGGYDHDGEIHGAPVSAAVIRGLRAGLRRRRLRRRCRVRDSAGIGSIGPGLCFGFRPGRGRRGRFRFRVSRDPGYRWILSHCL